MRKLSSFCLLSACLLLAGDAAKMKAKSSSGNLQDSMLTLLASTDSRSQKVSSMESMVMELAKQAKMATADSGNTSELVDSIKPVLQDMLSNVFTAADSLNASCEASRQNLTTCPQLTEDTLFHPPHFNGNWETLRNKHRSCREEVPLLKAEADHCSTMRDNLLETEEAALETFRSLNIFNSPQECQIASSTSAEDYYKRMYDHFDAQSAQWWTAYEHLDQVVKNLTAWNCSKPTNAYYIKVGQCQRMQLELEETACDVYSRTNESCAALGSCQNARWQFYSEVVASNAQSLSALQDEYRATRRIQCLLEAFAADDVDQKLEECIQKRYSTSAVNSTCLENFGIHQKPTYVTPKVCGGIEAILSPADKNFRASEYDARNIEAGPCLAPCCSDGEPFFQFNMIPNTWVPWHQYFWGTESMGMYVNWEDAKRACELATSVRCWGILDQWCDGGSEEQPFHLIGAGPTLKRSSQGTCIYEMGLGSPVHMTTFTTTVPIYDCTWEVNVSRSDEGRQKVWKTYHVPHQGWDERYRFSGCSPEGGGQCQQEGAPNGIRLLVSRENHPVGEGVCCDEVTNEVVSERPVACNGFKDEYKKHAGKDVPGEKHIKPRASEPVGTWEEARKWCLKHGAGCVGIFDERCDGAGYALVTNITVGDLGDSEDGSCLYEKLAEQ